MKIRANVVDLRNAECFDSFSSHGSETSVSRLTPTGANIYDAYTSFSTAKIKF